MEAQAIELNAFGCTQIVAVDEGVVLRGEFRKIFLGRIDADELMDVWLETQGMASTHAKREVIFEYRGDKNEARLPIFYFKDII